MPQAKEPVDEPMPKFRVPPITKDSYIEGAQKHAALLSK